jgi:methylenetetrahydrofolate dehydrogenase (NADP+)/methenyltetrahydrofolate cyclohydrolase
MSATILDGRALARDLRAELQADVAAFKSNYDLSPLLAVVQVQGDAASERYVRTVRKLCRTMGVEFWLEQLPANVSQAALDNAIARLSADARVHGVLIEMPLPPGLSAEQAIMSLDYHKDVDGIHPMNTGLLAQGRLAWVPNTPAGGLELLKRYGIELTGRRVAMVGHSVVVGRPLAALFLHHNATVTICHVHTQNLGSILRDCEIVAVAVGVPGLITADMVQPGVVAVDFGINVQPDGSVVGDFDFPSVSEIASAITPVPGGTGPVTNVMLLRNVMMAARQQMKTRQETR